MHTRSSQKRQKYKWCTHLVHCSISRPGNMPAMHAGHARDTLAQRITQKHTHTHRDDALCGRNVCAHNSAPHTHKHRGRLLYDRHMYIYRHVYYICSFSGRQCVHQVAEIAFFKSLGYQARASAMSYAYATNILLQHIYYYYTTCPIMAIAIAVLVAVAVAFAAAAAAAGLAA